MALTKIVSDGIATGAVTTTQIAAGAVTAADLENSGVTAGTYGSSSAIPAITVDAKGRITSASTNSVSQVGGNSGVDFNDNVKARFGTDNDLQVFHDGSRAYVAANDVRITNNAVTETMASFIANGAASLYYDDSKKLATTSGGIDVTGSVTCTGLTVNGNGTINGVGTIQSSTGVLILRDNDDSGEATAQNYIEARTSDGTARYRVGDTSANGNVYISNITNNAVIFQTGNTDRCLIDSSGHLLPSANNSYDLGTSSNRWRNVYTNDLNLSNEGSANDVDGTWGNWTIQEGEDDLFLLNRRNGKKYKFNLSEVN